jgi:hypothetical protein
MQSFNRINQNTFAAFFPESCQHLQELLFSCDIEQVVDCVQWAVATQQLVMWPMRPRKRNAMAEAAHEMKILLTVVMHD